MKEVLYRYSSGTGDVIVLDQFDVLRHTRAGKWIDHYGTPKFVLNDSHKRFAHETKEGALDSFVARKNRQVRILTAQLEAAKSALRRSEHATPETLQSQPSFFQFEGLFDA